MSQNRALLDQTFTFDEPWISDTGTVLERASEGDVDDVALIHSAAQNAFAAIVFLDEGYLLSRTIRKAARDAQVAVVATKNRDPWRAAELVQQYADDIVRLPPGSLSRLLADGLQEVEQ